MNKFKFYLLLLVIIFGIYSFPQSGIASDINHLRPLISKGKKTVGDTFTYSYTLSQTPFIPSINISFSNPSENDDILIVTQSVQAYKKGIRYQAKLISFKTGVINFPSANIFTYYIEPVSVTIASVINPSKNISPQSDYLPYQDYSDIILFLVSLILIAGIFVFLYYYRKYQRAKKIIITPEQKHALWVETCACFRKVSIPDPIKPYYVESSEKLKICVKICLGIDILDLTSEETKAYFKDKNFEKQNALLESLDTADLVKFAKHHPTMEEFQIYQATALQFLSAHEPALNLEE